MFSPEKKISKLFQKKVSLKKSLFQKIEIFIDFFVLENDDFFEEKKRFFENFRFSIFSKNIFHRFFSSIVSFFLSYLMPNPCKWHRATPSVAPVRTANTTSKNGKIMKIIGQFLCKTNSNTGQPSFKACAFINIEIGRASCRERV